MSNFTDEELVFVESIWGNIDDSKTSLNNHAQRLHDYINTRIKQIDKIYQIFGYYEDGGGNNLIASYKTHASAQNKLDEILHHKEQDRIARKEGRIGEYKYIMDTYFMEENELLD
jgi:hypothetical protein